MAAIVLCTYGIDLTLDCLASLQAQDYPLLDVIVVDNNSQKDDTVKTVSAKSPPGGTHCFTGKSGVCQWQQPGHEKAIELRRQFIFLINNDTRLSPDCVSTLVSAVENNPQAGAVGPMVHTFDMQEQIGSAGGKIDWHAASAINIGAGELDCHQYPARAVDFINGCGLMVTRNAVERVGMLIGGISCIGERRIGVWGLTGRVYDTF